MIHRPRLSKLVLPWITIAIAAGAAGSLALAGDVDTDGDGVGDLADNCVFVANSLQRDDDFDNVGSACDCSPAFPGEFNTLGPPMQLLFHNKSDLTWQAPVETGGTGLVFDLLRSPDATDFSSADCVASDVSGLSASDPAPPADRIAYYLLRAQGGCGGNLGIDSNETRRVAGSCPAGVSLPQCTENHEDVNTCPDNNPTCGGQYQGGVGCQIAGQPNCYSSGLRSYGVSEFGPAVIDFAGDVDRLAVFFANQGPEAFGLMHLFDADNLPVGPPIQSNGDCAAFMPPIQLEGFARPVRRIVVESIGGPTWIDDLTVNPDVTTVGGFQINQLEWFGLPSPGWGEISFQLFHKRGGSGVEYLNVIDPGQLGAPGGWLIQNFPIVPGVDEQRYATTFDMTDFSFGPLEIFIDEFGFGGPPPIGGGLTVVPQGGNTFYDDNDLFGRPNGPPDPPSPPNPNGTTSFQLSLGFIREVHHTGMPDKAQGKNECAPTSAANSFVWLDAANATVDLPDDVDKPCEVRDKLKDAKHMKTSSVTGTTDANMIKGKLQFIADNMLPLTVEFQDDSLGGANITHAGKTAKASGTKPTFDWIFDQLQKGQDVELGMTWKPKGGHWVTLTGAYDYYGVKMLTYNDPDDKKKQTKFSFVGTSEENAGFLELECESDNTVDIAVAESPE